MKTASMVKAIVHILQSEETLEDKLDLLTAISITAKNDEVFRASEEIRNELCAGIKKEKRANAVLDLKEERETDSEVQNENNSNGIFGEIE